MNGKYFWLKLKKDFFKRHDIKIIEGMPDGKAIVLFYIKLMLESVDHEGELRFNQDIPYTPEMLASVTDTEIDVVNHAISVLHDFELLVVDENKTIVLPKVKDMVGFETEWAKKKRKYRETHGQTEDAPKTDKRQCQDNVPDMSSQKRTMSDKSKSIEIEKEIELDINRDNKLSLVQPKILSPEEKMFMEFWDAYPKKVDRKGCEKKFIKIKDLPKIFPGIMSALESQKQSKQWNEENGKYIPHPSTWINQERWNLVNEVAERQIAIEEAVSDEVNDFM